MGIFAKIKKAWYDSIIWETIDEEFYDELEESLIMADLGASVAADAIKRLRDAVYNNKIQNGEGVKQALRDILEEKLSVGDTALDLSTKPSVVLIIGVNGVGKTTSIGKLAHRFKQEGRRVLLCAADTFRAAAADQLEIWANRAECELVRSKEGADPGAVLFDSLAAAKARGVDVVLCDTAGRLHNKANLMNELSKLRRIIDDGTERAAAGEGLQGNGRSYGHHFDQTRRYGERRHLYRHRAGAGRAGQVRGTWRGHRRSAAVRCKGICGRAHLSGSAKRKNRKSGVKSAAKATPGRSERI